MRTRETRTRQMRTEGMRTERPNKFEEIEDVQRGEERGRKSCRSLGPMTPETVTRTV